MKVATVDGMVAVRTRLQGCFGLAVDYASVDVEKLPEVASTITFKAWPNRLSPQLEKS